MRSERGQSLSLFVCLVVAALLLVAGLVIDGSRQSDAVRRTEYAAAAAARVATDLTAAERVAGHPVNTAAAIGAAKRWLATQSGIAGEVSVLPDGTIRVTTRTSVPTVILSVIGIGSLNATGQAEAQLFAP